MAGHLVCTVLSGSHQTHGSSSNFNETFSSSVTLATAQAPNSHVWLVATRLASTALAFSVVAESTVGQHCVRMLITTF